MFHHCLHFLRLNSPRALQVYAPSDKGEARDYGVARYGMEVQRLLSVLDEHLEGREYMVGDAYTIADMACYPWVARYERHKVSLADFPEVSRWFFAISQREAVVAAYQEASQVNKGQAVTQSAGNVLFGQTAETIRKAVSQPE